MAYIFAKQANLIKVVHRALISNVCHTHASYYNTKQNNLEIN